MAKNDEIKINRADFSFGRSVDAAQVRCTVKSSYEIPAELHRSLRMLSARVGRKLNVLVEEAFRDLISKYGG